MTTMRRCAASTRVGTRCKHKAYCDKMYLCHAHFNLHTRICNICLDPICTSNNEHVTKCNHLFHTGCFSKWIQVDNTCPCCRTKLNTYIYINLKIYRNCTSNGAYTTFWLKTNKFHTVDECFRLLTQTDNIDSLEDKISLSRTVIEMTICHGESTTMSVKRLPQHILRRLHSLPISNKLDIITDIIKDMI